MKAQQKREIEALSSILDCITKQPIMHKADIREAEQRLDKILASLDQSKKLFKRLT